MLRKGIGNIGWVVGNIEEFSKDDGDVINKVRTIKY